MTTAFNRAPWGAPLVLVAVLLAGLVPETADAHGDYGHEAPPSGATGESTAPPGLGAAALATTGLSPFCPGGPGNICECGTVLALVRADKAFALHYGGCDLPVPRPVARIKPLAFSTAPPSAPLLSPASPRAPPLYS